MDQDGPAAEVVLEVLEGVAPFTVAEVARQGAGEVLAVEPTEVRLRPPDLRAPTGLRTVVAAYLSVVLDVPRPRSMLSPDRVRALADAMATARRVARPASFASFRLSAAGADSPEFRRLAAALAAASGLAWDQDEGEMLLRVRRRHPAWEVLVRLTPRPLSARPWRVANYAAAVNATIAAALVEATGPTPDDAVLDLMCGSGTIVLERLARGPVRRLVAVDRSAEALAMARANQRAARFRGRVDLRQADVRSLAGSGDRFDVLWANLPWGELSGSHAENDVLYPDVLRLARELAADRARFLVLTHDLRRFEAALLDVGAWTVEDRWRFFQKGHRPCLYRLRPAR